MKIYPFPIISIGIWVRTLSMVSSSLKTFSPQEYFFYFLSSKLCKTCRFSYSILESNLIYPVTLFLLKIFNYLPNNYFNLHYRLFYYFEFCPFWIFALTIPISTTIILRAFCLIIQVSAPYDSLKKILTIEELEFVQTVVIHWIIFPCK